jgi:hypothetical protein
MRNQCVWLEEIVKVSTPQIPRLDYALYGLRSALRLGSQYLQVKIGVPPLQGGNPITSTKYFPGYRENCA